MMQSAPDNPDWLIRTNFLWWKQSVTLSAFSVSPHHVIILEMVGTHLQWGLPPVFWQLDSYTEGILTHSESSERFRVARTCRPFTSCWDTSPSRLCWCPTARCRTRPWMAMPYPREPRWARKLLLEHWWESSGQKRTRVLTLNPCEFAMLLWIPISSESWRPKQSKKKMTHVCNFQVWNFVFNLHHDPRYWDKPWEFRPERFLDENGHLVAPDHINKRR